MAIPTLLPKSTLSAIILPITGTVANVSANLPFGIYSSDVNFLSGASDQVGFVYKMLGRRYFRH